MPNLPKRTLGRTGLEVTTLGFGAMELRNGVSDKDAAALLNAVLDAGINFIDTSIDYGESEAHIGKHIANRRAEYYLASKCGCVPGGGWRRARAHRQEHPRGRRELPAPDEHGPPRPRAVPPQPHAGRVRGEGRAAGSDEAARRGQGALRRRLRHPAQPRRADRHGRVRCLPDPLLRPPARPRGRHRPGLRSRRRHHHPRRRGPRRARGLARPPLLHGRRRTRCRAAGTKPSSTSCSTACRASS